VDSALEKAGKTAFPDFDLEVVASCPSTQDLALQKAAGGGPEGFCVVALTQTEGRGRQGRSWSAEPGSSLLCSLVLRPSEELRPLLTLMAGVVVAEAVAQLAGVEVRLKWPNDVLVEGKKLAGILAEASGDADRYRGFAEECMAEYDLDGWTVDDLKPYVFVTRDFGKTFQSASGNLPSSGNVRATS